MERKCRMYPETIPNDWRRDPKRRAELQIYDRMSEQLGEEWVVFYDVAWLAKVRQQVPEDGQTDFVCIHPDRGILLIEVKGGLIDYDARTGVWTSTSLTGNVNVIKDAFEQVQRSKYALANKFATVPALAHLPIRLYDAVAFPDVKVGTTSLRLDAPREVVLDMEALLNVEAKLLSIFSFWSAGSKHPIPDKAIDQLIQLFAPSIQLRNPLAAQFAIEHDEVVKMSANQFQVLNGFRKVPRLAVAGCAGSGKTILAVEKARHLADEGFSTLLTCYNKHLADFLQSRVGPHQHLKVMTFHKLCSEVARAANVELPRIGSMSQEQLDAEYAIALCEAMSQRPDLKFDAIIVDEAQDFYKDWWDALDASLVAAKNSVLYAFYDDNQRLYHRDSQIPEDFVHYELYNNIRNTQPIFRCAQKYYVSSPGRRIEARGPAGRPIEWLKYANRKELQNVVGGLIRRLVKTEQIDCRRIAFLTPKSVDDEHEFFAMKFDDDIRIVHYNDRLNRNEIGCTTIKRFKGLEADVVVITELDENVNQQLRTNLENELYVAMTRAKHHLVVLSSKNFDDSLLR